MRNRIKVSAAATALLVAVCPAALASELVYHPANPAFGGNPLNGNYLLSQAQAQGLGTKSGPQGPDLSGLEDALNGIGDGSGGDGTVIVVPGSGSGGSNAGTNARMAVPLRP
jgi:curli production assembly/transport component CsgF